MGHMSDQRGLYQSGDALKQGAVYSSPPTPSPTTLLNVSKWILRDVSKWDLNESPTISQTCMAQFCSSFAKPQYMRAYMCTSLHSVI